MPTVDDLVSGWIRHFFSADRSLRFVAAEQELSIALADVILAGRVDVIGDDFFGEWKTLSKWSKSGWREKWRFHPQSLTYGLLLRETHPEVRRFTIRVAFKSDPPSYDHEWFTYSQGELDTWRDEVLRIARAIQSERHNLGHWALNPLSCFKYGPKYPCAYLYRCTHQTWNIPVAGLTPRQPHLDLERKVIESIEPRKPLVLDATRITKYLECPEDYRGSYVEGGLGMSEPESEALTLGKGAHELLGEFYRQLALGTLPKVAATAQTFPMGFELQED